MQRALIGHELDRMDTLDDQQRAALEDAFDKVIATLTRGELFFPSPFDARASWALALNECRGHVAQHVFDATCRQFPRRFRVVVQEVAGPEGEFARDAVRLTGTRRQLASGLLDEAMNELTSSRGATNDAA